MYMVDNYRWAVIFCVVTMLCWGSWANTQKLAGKRWRFELFYWDYVFGVLAMAVIFAFTLGSMYPEQGPTFLKNANDAWPSYMGWAALGGVVFNIANILLVAAIAIAGMAVAFPIGIGLALVVGVAVNFAMDPDKYLNPELLWVGVGLIVVAIILDAIAYSRLTRGSKGVTAKGILLSVCCGVLMGLFYFLVARSMPKDFSQFDQRMLTPYTAMWFFAIGMLASNLVVNHLIMARPVAGEPVTWKDYGRGKIWQHALGIIGGMIWGVGMTLNIVAMDQAGPAVSYGLGQGATMVAAIWGVFVWREFRGASKGTAVLLFLMFVAFLVGLALVVLAQVDIPGALGFELPWK